MASFGFTATLSQCDTGLPQDTAQAQSAQRRDGRLGRMAKLSRWSRHSSTSGGVEQPDHCIATPRPD